METDHKEIIIIGSGMVGLSIAYQLIDNNLANSILVLDKEKVIGMHSSGRNSGVLHAGLYYKPDSIKAKVCVSGAKKLKEWIVDRKLPINNCGKVIIPHLTKLDSQLDILAERGRRNGAEVEFLDERQLKDLVPAAHTSTGRALWSPNTSVVKPMKVLNRLKFELEDKGVEFIYGVDEWKAIPKDNQLVLKDGTKLNYDHLFNCSGLQADRVAHQFEVGKQFSLIPFKGIYWELKSDCPIKIATNLYPVPDLNLPFLGVHFTPNTDPNPTVTIGPTATPAWGRENYNNCDAIEFKVAASTINLISRQYLLNIDGFRRYVHEQAFLSLKPLFLRTAQQLIPTLKNSYLKPSRKVGIRPQLLNIETQKLQEDFICIPGKDSTHVLNAISPAFTASFSLADLILEKAGFIAKT